MKYYAIIYCNPNRLNNSYLCKGKLLNRYDIWLVKWGNKEPSYECGIWQYTDSGKVSGVNGNVNMNVSYKDYRYVMESANLNFIKSWGSSQGNNNQQYDLLF